jgi:hypothetical protein
MLPDATNKLDQLMLVLLMVPMGDPRPVVSGANTYPSQCNMGMPAVLWGLSGTAKSSIVKQAARRLGLPVEVVYPGTHAPEDFSSLPVVIDNKLMAACMLTQVTNLNNMGGGLLFLDEVSCAAPAVQGAMLSMVLERQVGAVKFHPGIRIISAANPPEYSAGGWALAAPFANRMAHFFVHKPPTTKLVEWMLSEGSHRAQTLEAPQQQLQQNWGQAWARVRGLWAGFVNANPSVRHSQPAPENAQAGYCWPSDRTWEFAFRCVATCRALGLENSLEALLIESCVGEGAANEYIAWSANADLPDPREVLEKGWKLPRQLDRIHAVYAAITALVIDEQEGAERYRLATQAWKRLQDLNDAGHLDLTCTHAQALITDGLGPVQPGVPKDLKEVAEQVVLKIGRLPSLVKNFSNR